MKMIKNIIFDLGGVLIDFNDKNYLQKIGFNNDDIIFFSKMIFHSNEWSEYNTSKFSLLETKNNLIKKNPDYTKKIEFIFDNLNYSELLFEIKNTANYLIELKNRNYNIFILSDASLETYDYFKNFDFFEYVDGAVYSFEVGSTKPNSKSYVTLLNKYNINPKETIFIDDKLCNLDRAETFNLKTILYTNLAELKTTLEELIKD